MTCDKLSITLKACSSKQDVAIPKTAVEKVVRPTQADTNDKCRFSPFPFSVKYGNFANLVRPSSENLYKISLNKECNDTKTTAELCEQSKEFHILRKDFQGLWMKSKKNLQLLQQN